MLQIKKNTHEWTKMFKTETLRNEFMVNWMSQKWSTIDREKHNECKDKDLMIFGLK